MEWPVLIEKDAEAGGHTISCLTLIGRVSQGETEEALKNIKDAI